MAAKAARKHATPPPVVDADDDDNNKDNVLFFALKVLPNATTPDICARKLLEKASESECKLQLGIIKKVNELNLILKDKRPMDLFRDQTCSSLYQQILDMQIAQHFSSTGWKVVCFATLVPMIGQLTLYTAPVFHTRRCNLFFSWTIGQKFHSDVQMSPLTDIFNDENVDQQIRSVGKPTHDREIENDWPIDPSLENLDQSSSSTESKGSSIDSGKTLVSPQVPIMDANDVSHLESFVESTNQDSYLDISFINVKRRLNLSKQDKIDILEGNPSSVHSTPIRTARPRDNLRPKLGGSFKKSSMTMLEKNLAGQAPKSDKPGYLTRFLNAWFRNQIDQMSSELEFGLGNRNENMEN